MKQLTTILTSAFIVLSLFGHAQESILTHSNDSTLVNGIPAEDIPTLALETQEIINDLSESLVSEEALRAEKAISDSVISKLERVLDQKERINYQAQLTRNLSNSNNLLSDYQDEILDEIDKTEQILEDLSEHGKELNAELSLWGKTKENLDPKYAGTVYDSTIDDVIRDGESLSKSIVSRTQIAFSLITEMKACERRIDRLRTQIKDIIQTRQDQLFEKTHPSVFSGDFYRIRPQDEGNYFLRFLAENKAILKQFYRKNETNTILYTIYTLILIGLFLYVKIKNLSPTSTENNTYQRALTVMLNRPISAALILSIFTSAFFFSKRPVVILDLYILALTIPILDIIAHVGDKKIRKYLIFFAVLILLRFTNYIFPPLTAFHRIILLLMGCIELYGLYSIKKGMDLKKVTSPAFNKLVKIILNIHLISAWVGVLTNFTGHLRVAEIAIDFPITNTLVGFLLVISNIALVGLLQIAIDGKLLGKFNVIKNRRKKLKERISRFMMFIVSALWIIYVLQILRLNDEVYNGIAFVFTEEIDLGSTSFTFGSVVLFFFIIWLSVIVSDIVKAFLEDDVLHKIKLKKGVPRMVSVVIRFSVITFGIIVAVSAAGMPVSQLTIILSAFSVGIGFGLQNVVNNFVSGIVLLFERPLQIGDTVEVNNLLGNVKAMGIRSSSIRTFDGAEVIVPNANLISNEVINWTKSDKRRRIEIFSGVAYGSDVYKVRDILKNILTNHPDILQDPEPLVLFNDLGESSLDFRLLFWTDNFDNWIIIKSEIVFAIHDAMYEAGIEIPFPQRDLHIKEQPREQSNATQDSDAGAIEQKEKEQKEKGEAGVESEGDDE